MLESKEILLFKNMFWYTFCIYLVYHLYSCTYYIDMNIYNLTILSVTLNICLISVNLCSLVTAIED